MHKLDVDVALAGVRERDGVLSDCGVAEAGLTAVSLKVDVWICLVETMIGRGEELGGDDARPAVVKPSVEALVR